MRVLWTQTVPTPPRGLVLAREVGVGLVWNASPTLFRFTLDGLIEGRAVLPEPPTALACAEDGSVVVAGGSQGQVWFLGPTLDLRLQLNVPARVVGLALTVNGQRLAVADSGGGLRLFARSRLLWMATTLRPLQYLAFVPERPLLVGAADHGLVACFNRSGACLWRDGVVAHVGSLAVSGGGEAVALACFTSGLLVYGAERPHPEPSPSWPAPCRLGALSYSADRALIAGLDGQVTLRDRDNQTLAAWTPPATPVALALTPLADRAVVLTSDGQLSGIEP